MGEQVPSASQGDAALPDIPQPAFSLNLTGRRFLITGGGRGLGEAAARALTRCGAACMVIDATPSETPTPWPHAVADVADGPGLRAAVDELANAAPLDGLVAAAGVVPPWHSPLSRDLGDLDRVLAVNVRGVANAINAVVPHMRDGGTVVALASLNSWKPDPNLLAYVASKHAVVGVVRSSALALGERGIRVNAVAPGPVATAALVRRMDERAATTGPSRADALRAAAENTALGRIATADDVANAVLFLSSPLSAAITGHILPVDGGVM